MTWYELLRLGQSYWRWAVPITSLIVLVRAVRGANQSREWTHADARAARLFFSALDIQLTVGVTLYFGFSPFFSAIYHSFSETMKDPNARFFGIEHQTAMLIATAVAHVGMDRAKRAASGPARHRVMRTTMIVFLLIVLAGLPWPWRPYGRPLFRTSWSTTMRLGDRAAPTTTASGASVRQAASHLAAAARLELPRPSTVPERQSPRAQRPRAQAS